VRDDFEVFKFDGDITLSKAIEIVEWHGFKKEETQKKKGRIDFLSKDGYRLTIQKRDPYPIGTFINTFVSEISAIEYHRGHRDKGRFQRY
jgi:hypothetical protein